MKFCEKLQKIRKENNITQEELASRLDVSRQAVSKWESGNAYPDTEKLIQISKIFKVSLDELINDDEVINKNQIKDKKATIMETINMIFNYIQKTITMFWSMKFGEKIKFIFEMALLVLGIYIAAMILDSIIIEIVRKLFFFLPYKALRYIVAIFDGLLYILWIILGAIIVFKMLKSRYLDYFVIITDDNVSERTIEEPIKELKDKKDYKVVIRDPADSSLNLFKKFLNLIVLCLKVIALFIFIPVIFMFILFIILFTISLAFTTYGLFFNGITLSLIGIILFVFIILLFIYNLIFNRKNSYGKIFMVFIISLVFVGVGAGLSFMDVSKFDIYEEEVNKNNQELIIPFSYELVIPSIMDLSDDKIVISDTQDIKLDIITNSNNIVNYYSYNNYDDENEMNYKIVNIYASNDGIDNYKELLNDLKKKKINVNNFKDDYEYTIDKVYISEDNLTKIRDNYNKYYNIED